MIRTLTAAMLASLLLGCAKPAVIRTPIEVPVTVYQTVPVPAVLLRPCSVELGNLNTNADLEAALAARIVALKQCDADKAAIGELK